MPFMKSRVDRGKETLREKVVCLKKVGVKIRSDRERDVGFTMISSLVNRDSQCVLHHRFPQESAPFSTPHQLANH